MRKIVLLASIVAALAGLRETAAADEEFDVVLHDAAGPQRTLLLDVTRQGGQWQRAWGLWADLGHNFHPGRLTDAKWDKDQCEFEVALTFVGDTWNAAGRAQYRVKLSRKSDGSWQGSHEGTFRGDKVSGRATAALRPAQPNRKPGYQPARPGEHPRILFRQQDLPALRAKAKTPLGQAALAAMNDPAGLGIKYQLSGDKTLADEAMRIVEKMMPQNHDGGHGRGWGECLYQIGVAYDLCHDAWPKAFRREVADYMVWATERLFYRPGMVTGTANWHPCSNYAGPIYQGPAFAGLALWGEKGPKPQEPAAPAVARDLPPADGYAPPAGVPVVKVESDIMPADWLFAGGFQVQGDESPLAGLGGAKARPAPGTELVFGGRSEKFRLLSHDQEKGYYTDPAVQGGKTCLDVTRANGMAYFSTNYFYTVVENDRPRWVRLETGSSIAHAYLAGQRLAEGDCVQLAKGLYPLLVVAKIDIAFPHRRFLLRPRLVEQTAEQVKAHDAARQAEHQAKLKEWQFDCAEWRRSDEADQRFVNLFEMSKRKMYWHYRLGVGTGGFQAEVGSYSLLGIQGPDVYAPAYRNMFCVDASPYDDITHYVPRKMFGQVFRPYAAGDPKRGKPPRPDPLAQDINGSPALAPRMLAAMFPIVPEPWKPTALWAWNYHAGIRGPEEAAGLVDSPSMAAMAFLNYPLDMQPQPPQGVMPLAWEAPTFGYYGFRNAWQGGDDFLAQAFLKATLISGWNGANAGTFRLLGLGHVWAHGPTARDRCRWEENVVQLPEDSEINDTALGRLMYHKAQADGSGVVSVDLADVYANRAMVPEGGKPPASYEKYTSFRRPSAFRDSGIQGLRSIAVDYSGLSGAPCLLIVADSIRGGKSKVWTWQLGDEPKKNGDPPGNLKDTTVRGNTFTIRKGDGAVLRATFVSPAAARLTAEVRKEAMIGRGGSTGGQTLPRPIPGLFAQGPQGTEGDFLVVVTVGRGEPPAVKIEGEGLKAKVTVGKRTIRFDGEKIMLEQ